MNHREFFEGVRALLIDKDKAPKWSYRNIANVRRDDVKTFFDRDETLNLDITKA